MICRIQSPSSLTREVTEEETACVCTMVTKGVYPWPPVHMGPCCLCRKSKHDRAFSPRKVCLPLDPHPRVHLLVSVAVLSGKVSPLSQSGPHREAQSLTALVLRLCSRRLNLIPWPWQSLRFQSWWFGLAFNLLAVCLTPLESCRNPKVHAEKKGSREINGYLAPWLQACLATASEF